MSASRPPRVLLISQWPKIKNAEYELIERIKRTGYDVRVVDYLGFDVGTGLCVDGPDLAQRYDFAVSFHYDTPKFLNLPTLLWVANPLEFMHAQPTYRTRLLQHLRAYDDYAYNGSDALKDHVRKVVGSRWRDTGLALYGACARSDLVAPEQGSRNDRLFYCGVNWEALSDKAGRAQGLLERLQARDVADFYGPEKLLGKPTWGAFPAYKSMIPFDGTSMFPAMRGYAAVLALSSPAHMKSRTSSGRAIEGFAAGTPVISDENPHVRHQFGDLPYYFRGDTDEERAAGIIAALEQVRAQPCEALARVREAQARIAEAYCYDVCLAQLSEAVRAGRYGALAPRAAAHPVQAEVDVFSFRHDPYAPEGEAPADTGNEAYLQAALANVPQGMQARLHRIGAADLGLTEPAWSRMRLGAKIAALAARATGTHAVFVTQHDFLQHDHFAKLADALRDPAGGLFVAGFFVNDLSQPAPEDSGVILRNSASTSTYRWTQDAIAQHQMGTLCLDRAALARATPERVGAFDVLAPLALVLDAMAAGAAVERSRYLTVRVSRGYYHRYLNAFDRVARKGYWALQMDLASNVQHELNALYDLFHEDAALVAIVDRIAGHDMPPVAPVDPAVRNVATFIDALRPWYRRFDAIRKRLGLS